ncbi:MAG TPA: hypothetical protein VF254_11380, partial [Gammaproteobacteria bacterium]
MDNELEQRLAIVHELAAPARQLDALEQLFAEYINVNTAAAGDIAEEAVALARAVDSRDAFARAALLAGTARLRRYALERADQVLVEGLEGATDSRLRNRLLLMLAETRFTANHYADARDAAQQVMVDADLSGDVLLRAESLIWLGAAAAQLSEYQTALESLHLALKLLDEAGHPELAARPMNYIAVVHEEVGEDTEAVRWYQRALELLAAHPDPHVAVRVFANYGELAARQGERDRAGEFLRRAANDALRIGDRSLRAWCFWALANQALADDDINAARSHFTMALRDVELGHAERTRAEVFTGVGRFHARLGNHDRAIEYLSRGLRHAERARVNREIYKSHLALSE